MKNILLTLLVLTSLVNAQTITVPNKPAPLSYISPNAAAAAFVDSRGITDPIEVRYFHQWYNGLDSLGIVDSDILYMASFRSQHNPVTGTTVFPMKGPSTTTTGSPTFTTNGVQFDGTGSKYITIANTFGASLANFSVISAFKANFVTAQYQTLGGGYESAGVKGPVIWLNGSPSAGYSPNFTYVGWSGNGTTNGTVATAGTIGARCVTGGPEFLVHNFSATYVSTKMNADVIRQANVTGYGPAANGAANWRLGRMVDTTTASMNGEIAFYMVLNKIIPETTQNELRKLYTRTLGMTYIPRVNLYFDGDSITAGAAAEVIYSHHLGTNVIWGNYSINRNVAVSGSTQTGVNSRWTNDIARFAIDDEYAIRQYYFDAAGANDINDASPTKPQELLAAKKVIWNNARKAGMKVVAFSLIYTVNTAGNAQYRANWTNYNTLLKSATPYYDYLIKLDEDTRLTDYTDTTYFQVDQIHPNTQGQKVIEGLLTSTILYP